MTKYKSTVTTTAVIIMTNVNDNDDNECTERRLEKYKKK